MIRRLHAAAAALLLAVAIGACGEIGSPLRSGAYEWRAIRDADTLSFHWARESLPVRFWAQDIHDFPRHTDSAIVEWEDAFLYREFDGTLVSDSSEADVIITFGFPPGGGGILTGRVTECEALTQLDLDFEARTLTLPIHIYVVNRFALDLPATQECFGLVMIHEVGHAIGIFNHSDDPQDIMFENPTARYPTLQDRQTAEVLYHVPANVTATRGATP